VLEEQESFFIKYKRVKVKVIPVHNQVPQREASYKYDAGRRKDVFRRGGRDLHILNPGTRWGCMVSFMPRRFSPGERAPLSRRLGGSQNWFGSGGKEKKSLPLPGVRTQSSNPQPGHYID